MLTLVGSCWIREPAIGATGKWLRAGAIDPVADQMCDEFPAFSWLVKAEAFTRFGYEPDKEFSSEPREEYGFVGMGCFAVPIEEAGKDVVCEAVPPRKSTSQSGWCPVQTRTW